MGDMAVERKTESPIWAILVGVMTGLLAVPVAGFVTFFGLVGVAGVFVDMDSSWFIELILMFISVGAVVVSPPVIGWVVYRRRRLAAAND